jgi:hypothetical protein
MAPIGSRQSGDERDPYYRAHGTRDEGVDSRWGQVRTERGGGVAWHATGLLVGSRCGLVRCAGKGRLLGRSRGKAGPPGLPGGKKGD